jgi:hypothetical protein
MNELYASHFQILCYTCTRNCKNFPHILCPQLQRTPSQQHCLLIYRSPLRLDLKDPLERLCNLEANLAPKITQVSILLSKNVGGKSLPDIRATRSNQHFERALLRNPRTRLTQARIEIAHRVFIQM